MLIIFDNHLPISLLDATLFLLGICCSINLLGYVIAGLSVGENLRGTAVAFSNAMSLIAAVLFQPLIGFFLTYFQDHFKNAFISGYQISLLILPVILFIAFCSVFWIKAPESRSPD